AFIAELDERGAAAFVFAVREARDQHASGQWIDPVRADGSARDLLEILDRFQVARAGGRGMDVVDKNLAGFEAGEPELATIVGEPAVMRFVPAADGVAVDHLPVIA